MLYLVFLPFIWWAAAITACAITPDKNFIQILETLSEKLEQPFFITYTPYTFKCILIFTAAYFLGIGIYESQKRNYRRGVEHGSAKWGNVSEICRRYCEKQYTNNLLLTQHFRMGLDGYKHKRNLNVLVVGGSGAGKSRTYAIPNIMQCNCSMVITDPKAELLRKTGGVLERNGYEVRVFDLINPETSWCYNPFAYVRDDKDVLKLINNLIRNTTPKGAQSSDPFWEKSETALLQALMLYLLHEAPPEEQNFPMIMEMLGSAQVKEDDEDYQSPLDILFERLEMRDPESIAVKQYAIYKQAAGKTAKSILISVGVRLAAFNLKQIANLTCTDELDLYSIGEKKVALFCCIPDADTSMNYLVGMIYSNLFQTLYYVADRKYGGRLPIPVHCIMDEWPNVALPDDFDKILATMRSRGISCSIIIQNIAQMKALFKDSYESLIGNCDEFLYLGGNEKEGHKYVSELLGKETLDTNTYGQTKGRSGSYSVNYQQTGRELLTPDEIRLLDNRKAILFIRGERPIMDDKYDLKKHVNFRYTEDGGASPYDYAKTPLAHDDLKIDINRLDDYELLSTEDILGE
ncbi:TPA: type IV secretory system conjugative DNA transfer family protein [Enterococcus faecium]|uniref:Type IV secretory system conjugative DNA transfer family protein n=1 Tax=Dorea longicatena TaxID=88431 RepID=A0A6L8S184_9FIRM|nr:type IV secretory system conjugative DNA transfer family protein [Dorea longicatena]HAP7448697.1 type IV secretory system conjugative DNA transfer family protein [Enterococcus faecium]MZK17207.1 type IV secretory system conjugative DNA transfer family protein [Dorea longicatena]MZK25104.1 type IV secretory system conjugative DNA transfer family protein [Dorea longicatena]MZK32629.1 type IV secretory system conjugative DNA transfer family protein [Dorea longicatena]MZK41255.1 type IV secreto